MTDVLSVADVSARIVRALALTEPNLDTSIGSVTRKIIDAVAEQIAPAYAVSHLLDYQYDIDSKQGSDLDDFCALFGIYRFPAVRATGTVTFQRPNPADRNYVIPANSQVATRTTPRILFATVTPAVLALGTTSVDVPVQAVVGGEPGNLPEGSLTVMVSGTSGVQGTTLQALPTTGGQDAEDDDSLRDRFKRTVFRSLAGTEDMFLANALEDTTPTNPLDTVATQANVIGASKRWREQVQIVMGEAVSSIDPDDVKYVFANSAIFGTDIDNGAILTEGIHFLFDNTVIPPTITGIAGALQNGGLYDLDFEYSPNASRNDPANGVTNRVDVWVNGQYATEADEVSYYEPTEFTGLAGDPMDVTKFVRQDTDDVHPTAGNYLLQLTYGPIITFPDTLVINGVTYTKGTDYWVVHDDTAFGYGPTSVFGLEWLSSNQPTVGQQIVLTGDSSYTYNRLPADVEARCRLWRLVTQDVRAHAAKRILLQFNFAVMYGTTYDRSVVSAAISSALADYLNSLGFNSVLQVSDLLQIVHEVAGVDNIRFLNSHEAYGDEGSYAIEQIASDGTRIKFIDDGGNPARATDLILAENEVPVFYNVNLDIRAQNSWQEPS